MSEVIHEKVAALAARVSALEAQLAAVTANTEACPANKPKPRKTRKPGAK